MQRTRPSDAPIGRAHAVEPRGSASPASRMLGAHAGPQLGKPGSTTDALRGVAVTGAVGSGGAPAALESVAPRVTSRGGDDSPQWEERFPPAAIEKPQVAPSSPNIPGHRQRSERQAAGPPGDRGCGADGTPPGLRRNRASRCGAGEPREPRACPRGFTSGAWPVCMRAPVFGGPRLSVLGSIQGSDPPPFGVCLKSHQLLQAAWGIELFW